MRTNLMTAGCFALLIMQMFELKAQALFREDFETAPVTSILNFGEIQLANGPSPCSKATRGTTADFNSSKVNFNNMQNPSYFLAVNPEVPCGGYYIATLNTKNLNFSSADSLRFKCRYFKSNTLGWSEAIMEITFSNGISNFIVKSQFTSLNTWSYLDIALPAFLISSSVTITFKMGGGEGVGLDDIEVVNIQETTGIVEDMENNELRIYSDPFSVYTTIKFLHEIKNAILLIYDIKGREVRRIEKISGQTIMISREDLPAGMYLLRLIKPDKNSISFKSFRIL